MLEIGWLAVFEDEIFYRPGNLIGQNRFWLAKIEIGQKMANDLRIFISSTFLVLEV